MSPNAAESWEIKSKTVENGFPVVLLWIIKNLNADEGKFCFVITVKSVFETQTSSEKIFWENSFFIASSALLSASTAFWHINKNVWFTNNAGNQSDNGGKRIKLLIHFSLDAVEMKFRIFSRLFYVQHHLMKALKVPSRTSFIDFSAFCF